MTKTYTSKYEDSGSGTIIPMGSSDAGSSNRIFPHLLDAISQIQQFYIIESKGKEIPDDFLTIRGKLNFFRRFWRRFFRGAYFCFSNVSDFTYDLGSKYPCLDCRIFSTS
ncbi:hypothetical protein BuS5_04030 (plasmid) [Desulfosarcina sp. BuS5]|uniref:hypothetical protein n=1 Tax=Desulfosarcina sp. BuS5 TaxID=933262 RepID=UPI0023790009|nr:hypothetical protein [Desulfosarcina sp. BuS5]WDN91017.1 hypothetical protein BuS5_03989 [Desulfosarcina sp. BuS5]WDN91058.1 hypothetical protein BuS5_04030 [Desulfosarcina sp. BuS5]